MNEFYSPSKVDSYLISMITSVVTNVLHSSYYIFITLILLLLLLL